MSRGAARRSAPTESAGTATPIWVWAVYVLGLLGAVVLAGSAVVSAVFVLTSDAHVDISFPALAVCLVLAVAAAALKAWRSRMGA